LIFTVFIYINLGALKVLLNRYADPSPLHSVSAIRSAEFEAFNIYLIKFSSLRWCSERHKMWGKFGNMELISSSVLPFKPQIFWWYIVNELLSRLTLSFTIKNLQFWLSGGFFFLLEILGPSSKDGVAVGFPYPLMLFDQFWSLPVGGWCLLSSHTFNTYVISIFPK
jgi:hypothetical protein